MVLTPSRVWIIPSALSLVFASTAAAADPKAKVTFQDQVAQVFRSRCNSCHNPDKQKGGLSLETFGSAMQGGGSGKVIEPGDLDGSTLYQLVTHKDEPKMPPNSPKIPDAEIDLIRQWIEGGALETSGSVAAVKAKPKFEFKLDPSAAGKPVGPPAMPENLPTEPAVVSQRAGAIVAMAASPWAPLVAIGGHKQVLLYRTTDRHLVGVLPFPEGVINVVKFSRNGALVLAGGGRGGQSGLAVVWDVKTGKRVFEIGKEYDVVLAADISPDHGQVALGGPGRVVRVYNTADGQLLFEMKKHTEWVTALEFSPDGVLLATGDRNNGLIVWEGQTGREFHDLRGHTAAITDVSWRPDSNVLASSSEDTTIRLWEMENGNQIKSWGAHGGGVASVRFAQDGRLVTTGRDRMTRLWDQNGGKQREFEPFGDLALEAVTSHDLTRVIAGDWSGEIRLWDLKTGGRVANLAANPAPIAIRLETAVKSIPTAQAAAEAAANAVAPAESTAAEKAALLTKAAQALAAATQQASQVKSAADAAEAALKKKAAEESVAGEALKTTQAGAAKAASEKAAAEKAMPEKAAAEKTAAESLASAKAAVSAAFAKKLEHDKAVATAVDALKAAATKEAAEQAASELTKLTLRATELAATVGLGGNQQAMAQARWEQAVVEKAAAPGVLANAEARLKTAEEAVKATQAQLAKLAEEKGPLAKAFADARTLQKTSEGAVVARKAEHDPIQAAKAAADKAVAEHASKRLPLRRRRSPPSRPRPTHWPRRSVSSTPRNPQ